MTRKLASVPLDLHAKPDFTPSVTKLLIPEFTSYREARRMSVPLLLLLSLLDKVSRQAVSGEVSAKQRR